MSRRRCSPILPGPLILTAALVGLGCGDPPSSLDADPAASVGPSLAAATTGASLAAIRQATARYQRIEAALADGYIPVSPCVAAPGLGGMGFHYLNPDYLNDAAIDPATPELLLYEPEPNGRLRLIGVEFMLIADLWDAVHAADPEFNQQRFDEHRGADTHGLPFDHYELHVWTWRHNAAGHYAPFNPDVSCDE